VDVPLHRPERPLDVQRIGIEMPAVMRQAAGQEGSGFLGEPGRTGCHGLIGGDQGRVRQGAGGHRRAFLAMGRIRKWVLGRLGQVRTRLVGGRRRAGGKAGWRVPTESTSKFRSRSQSLVLRYVWILSTRNWAVSRIVPRVPI